jgi:ribA/ribD-fused uncharacterized protein
MTKAFVGELDFCSNFYAAPLFYKGVLFPTSEHAFQWAKCKNQVDKDLILMDKSPAFAKQIGRKSEMIDNWDDVKYNIMRDILTEKFIQNAGLITKLLKTGNKELIEYNSWHDNIWGCCVCETCTAHHKKGTNWLGKILMEIRDRVKNV